VAPLIDRLASEVAHIHLVGHSFGGRLVTAAAAASTTDRLKSMTLLQSAFSHNAFSKAKKGFFRDVVGRQRVAGPIVITHTRNDEAVGVAYPLASRINGDRAAALGDENDEFGALGRNGAQRMEAGETLSGRLLPLGASYAFTAGTCFNLEASDFISGHSDVRGREVAQALRAAMR
jgi:pimeloyl-ACP methyl ester carboxylesterase